MKENYKGYSLFNDITDRTLRVRNRAVVLANITEENTVNKLITSKGVALLFGYFDLVPDDEKLEVQMRYKTALSERGYAVA